MKVFKSKCFVLIMFSISCISLISAENINPMVDAIYKNDTSEINRFLKEGFDVNMSSGTITPFIMTVAGNIDPTLKMVIMKYLINHKVNYQQIWFNGMNALFFANDDDIELIEYLIQLGLNPNAVDSNGFTPLMSAIANKKPKTIKKLLEMHADPTLITKRKVNSFMMATQSNKYLDLLSIDYSDLESKYKVNGNFEYRKGLLKEYINGSQFIITGVIKQVFENNENEPCFLLNTRYDKTFDQFMDDIVYCKLSAESGFVEGDTIKVYGQYKGVYKYETVYSRELTVPDIFVEYLSLVKERKK